jgi:recombinational DNA repair protein (RecF pathway)
MIYGDKLRDCAICGEPVPARAYQSSAARTCSPHCARALAVREHPELTPSAWSRQSQEEDEPS